MVNLLFKSATFVCVDMFVLISGWYGIRTRYEKVAAFIFQVLFYSVPLYFIMLAVLPNAHFSARFFIHIFLMDDYWFVPVYLFLYLFAPALNPFIAQSSRKEFRTLLLLVFAMQCVYGWLNLRESGYLEGCSPISFVLLYLIGAYFRRFPTRLDSLSRLQLLTVYSVLIGVNWLMAIGAKMTNSQLLFELAWQYSSPLIITASVCMLLTFSKLDIGYNKTINWIAASNFAVFLIHCFPYFYARVYDPFVTYLYTSLPLYYALPALAVFVAGLYAVSILIDQLRIVLYQTIRNSQC